MQHQGKLISSPDADRAPKSPEGDSGSCATSEFSVTKIESDDKATHFYTGLPSWPVFLHLYSFLSPFMCTTGPCLFTNKQNELLIVLMKLRLNLKMEDLASCFRIGLGSVSRIVQRWLDVMHIRLKFLIVWPERDILRHNLPSSFKQHYPSCVCTIDCSEIFIDTPTSFKARAQTYSNYKKNNTIKFLIGITPNGIYYSISFLSHCWVDEFLISILYPTLHFTNIYYLAMSC